MSTSVEIYEFDLRTSSDKDQVFPSPLNTSNSITDSINLSTRIFIYLVPNTYDSIIMTANELFFDLIYK